LLAKFRSDILHRYKYILLEKIQDSSRYHVEFQAKRKRRVKCTYTTTNLIKNYYKYMRCNGIAVFLQDWPIENVTDSKNEKQKTTLSRRDQTLCDYYDYIDFWHNVKRQTL